MKELSAEQNLSLKNILYKTLLDADENHGIANLQDGRFLINGIMIQWVEKNEISLKQFDLIYKVRIAVTTFLKTEIENFLKNNDEDDCYEAPESVTSKW